MWIAIGGDRAACGLENQLKRFLKWEGHKVVDLGAVDLVDPDDYSDFAAAVGRAVLDGRAERGVLLSGSGIGASIAANKLPGIRAGLCHDAYSACQGVEHDAMNVLVLGAWSVGPVLAEQLVRAFLGASYSAQERHERRLAKVRALEYDSVAPAIGAERTRRAVTRKIVRRKDLTFQEAAS